MSFYIVCQKKRNNPRMDVRICEKKCDLKDDCREFLAFHKQELAKIDFQAPVETRGIRAGV